ncbi:MAG: Phenol hydroxylase subunit [Massilia sp.]|nr:Phenol hydroxylase subunit [Massilia sp.]
MAEVNANQRWVRVQRDTDNGFVEFEFFVGDKDLYVDLILPAAAFLEFCANNRVHFLDRDGAPGDPAAASTRLHRIK